MFVHRESYMLLNLTPVRFYVHDSSPTKVVNHAARIFSHERLKGDFILGAVWFREGEEINELFSYSDLDPWDSNPNVSRAFVYRNGIYAPHERGGKCGEFVVIRGREEEWRRKHTKTLMDYMENPPDLPEWVFKGEHLAFKL